MYSALPGCHTPEIHISLEYLQYPEIHIFLEYLQYPEIDISLEYLQYPRIYISFQYLGQDMIVKILLFHSTNTSHFGRNSLESEYFGVSSKHIPV